MNSSDEVWENPERLALLAEQYKSLLHNAAFADLWGRIEGLRQNLISEIIRGPIGPQGEDETRLYRLVLYQIEAIQGIPAQVVYYNEIQGDLQKVANSQ